MNKIQFKSRKEASEFLASKNIDTSEWTEEKWQKINKSQAEIHMQALAEAMWNAMNESTPKELKAGEWHIPFGDKIDEEKIKDLKEYFSGNRGSLESDDFNYRIKISTARCARLSYMTFDGKVDYEKDIKLYDSLLSSHHMSPFEHCALCVTTEEYNENFKGKEKGWFRNFKGFKSYRQILEECMMEKNMKYKKML